jgi:hypothetical protein
MIRARLRTAIAGVVGAVACGYAAPVAAQAAFEVAPNAFAVSTSSHQAGAHADLTTSFAFAEDGSGAVDGIVRNAEVVLPVGFAGYPAAVKTCTPVQLQLETCPTDSQIGTIEVPLRESPAFTLTLTYPLYNMLPPPNATAVFGFVIGQFSSGEIVLSLGADYRVHAVAKNIFSAFEITRQKLTVWGVPADASHNTQRGNGYRCRQLNSAARTCEGGGAAASENPVPFLVNPTQCTSSPVEAELTVESWLGTKPPTVKAPVGPFTGCEALKFVPALAVTPEQSEATTPTGYSVDLAVPQTEGAESVATADLKDTVVKMPAGVVLSPSAANGLVACTEAQVGMENGKANSAPVECPNASKLGTVSVVTPALTGELKGALYLGGPASGPITGSPFTLYLTFAGHGVLVKIKGTATPDPVTGQITTTFDENPELPFSELKLQLSGGSRATLANPSVCGPYQAEADLTPWTAPFEEDDLLTSLPFTITGCQAPRFEPSFVAGTVSNQAGGYSPLSVTFSREDADEDLGGLSVITPPGVLGDLSKVPLCGEPEAAEGTCPPASQIGELTAGAGPGPEPYFIKGGRVYLTGPYGGAPFGLSIDVSEKAGPFDLGTGGCDCEVVRASVNVNPHTAQITVSNGALPTIKDGIPFQVKSVNVNINRPEFIFNPTNCDPMSVTATLSSTQGMSAQDQSHFQVTNCEALKFEPTFKVSTQGKTSKEDGASLDVKLAYPTEPLGDNQATSQANLAYVKVSLPKQLPSRLTTLQRACTAAQFESNPSGCPAASVVGHAKVLTPVLPVPLEGPAYFVSHGGEAFPSLIVVLQGDGVTIELVGDTEIKNGITSSTFASTPDVPFTTFELTLPEGPYSALTANGDLCRQDLVMPTAFVAQNGATLNQDTHIEVEGCSNALSIVSKRLKGRTLTLQVAVPAAGKLRAAGKGLSSGSKGSGGRETVTIKLHVKRHGKTKVKLSFQPAKGKRLSKTLTITA